MKKKNIKKSRFLARICWLSEEQGGRKSLPFGTKYVPILKLEEDVLGFEENWSAYIFNKKSLSENETISEVEYFSEFAPDNLQEKVRFQLYEGKKIVANGIILNKIIQKNDHTGQ